MNRKLKEYEEENKRLLNEIKEYENENRRLVSKNREYETENTRLLNENKELSEQLKTAKKKPYDNKLDKY